MCRNPRCQAYQERHLVLAIRLSDRQRAAWPVRRARELTYARQPETRSGHVSHRRIHHLRCFDASTWPRWHAWHRQQSLLRAPLCFRLPFYTRATPGETTAFRPFTMAGYYVLYSIVLLCFAIATGKAYGLHPTWEAQLITDSSLFHPQPMDPQIDRPRLHILATARFLCRGHRVRLLVQ